MQGIDNFTFFSLKKSLARIFFSVYRTTRNIDKETNDLAHTCHYMTGLCMSKVDGVSYLLHTLLYGLFATGGAGMEVPAGQTELLTPLHLLYKSDPTLLQHGSVR